MLAKKTLELNPHHPVIKEMLSKVKDAQATDSEVDPEVGEYAVLLYNVALLNSGFLIENPSDFVLPMQKLLRLGFGLRKDSPVEEIEVDIGSSEEAEEEQSTEEPDVEGEAEVEDNSESAKEEL